MENTEKEQEKSGRFPVILLTIIALYFLASPILIIKDVLPSEHLLLFPMGTIIALVMILYGIKKHWGKQVTLARRYLFAGFFIFILNAIAVSACVILIFFNDTALAHFEKIIQDIHQSTQKIEQRAEKIEHILDK